jgi:hypothetical protein
MTLLASIDEVRLVRKTPMDTSAPPAGREHRTARRTAVRTAMALQGDAYAHRAFVNGTGEIFGETTNWSNQTSNIPH